MRAAAQESSIVVCQDERGVALEGGIRVGLVDAYGRRPPVLGGLHHLVIPVRPLDEPDGDGQGLFPAPRQEPLDIVVRLGQVRLDRNAEVRVSRVCDAKPLRDLDEHTLSSCDSMSMQRLPPALMTLS